MKRISLLLLTIFSLSLFGNTGWQADGSFNFSQTNANVLFSQDGTFSIGGTSANRPQNINLAGSAFFFSSQNSISASSFPHTQLDIFTGNVLTAQLGQLDTGSQFQIVNPPGSSRNSILPNSAVGAGITAASTGGIGTGPFLISNTAFTDMAFAVGASAFMLGHDVGGAGNTFRHLVWRTDGGSDIGTADGGTTLLRPRNIYQAGFSQLLEIATPSNPAALNHRIYFKSDGNMYMLNSSGTETQVGGGGGGGGANQSLSNLTNPTAVNQPLLIPNVSDGPALQIGPIPGDGNLQASISTSTGFNGPTVLLIQGLGANSNNYNGIYIGNDDNEVGLNIFLNSSTRSADGGAENATIRMENGGALRIKAVGGLTLEGSVSFPNTINDDSNSQSIDPNSRVLLDSGGNFSVDWENRQLSDSAGDIIVDYEARSISGGNGTVVWNIDIGRFLDDNGTLSSNINTRLMYDNGGSQVMNWTNGYLKDPSSGNSIMWIDRNLVDSDFGTVVDWTSGFKEIYGGWDTSYYITSTADFTVADHKSAVFMGSGAGSQNVTMPLNPLDGQIVQFIVVIAQGITFLTTGGQSFIGTPPTSLTVGTTVRYIWRTGTGAWIPF